MQVDDEEGVEGESNSEGGESSDDENDDGKKVVCDDGNVPAADFGYRTIGEDEALRVSVETNVGDTKGRMLRLLFSNISSKIPRNQIACDVARAAATWLELLQRTLLLLMIVRLFVAS
nr:hypothetical protein [Tanacetum cinerariifolium]